MIKNFLNIATDDELKMIDQSARDVLERVGMKVPSDILLDYLSEYGARIDRDAQTAKFPGELLEKTLESCRRSNNTGETDGLITRKMDEIFAQDWGYECFFLYDARKKERRVCNTEEVIELIRLGEALPEINSVGLPVLDSSTDQRVEALIKCGYTDKFWVATMPLSGATAPVTMAGNVTLAAAEILGSWAIAKAVNEGAVTSATVISGILDMKSCKPSFSAPEAMLQDCCLWQLFKRVYKLEIGFDSGGYTDAKLPGFQASYEKTLRQMAFGMFAGVGLTIGALDGGRAFSPLQAMLDLEFNKGIWKLFGGIKIDAETIPLKEMEKIGFGESVTYLESEHTLKHFQKEFWHPEFLDRTSWQEMAVEMDKEEQMKKKAEEKLRNAMRHYSAPKVDEHKAKAISEVVAKARKELCN